MRGVTWRNRRALRVIPNAVGVHNPTFVAEGSWNKRLRASLARPLLSLAMASLTATARYGSSESVHRRERRYARWAERLVQLRVEVTGLGHVDPNERYVVVSLHEGFADVVGLLRLPLGLRFAARDELFDWPGLGGYLAAAGHVRVDRSPTRESMRRLFTEASQALAAGDSLVVFAQGSILGVEVAFQPGAMRLARRVGRPLLPVVVSGSHRVWDHPYSPTMRFGERMSVTVLPPIPPDALSVWSFRELEREMKRLALGEGAAPARRYRPDADGWWDGYPFEIDPDFSGLKAQVDAHRAALECRVSDSD